LTLPSSVACALLSDDLISVLLGPKWGDAAEIFRILAPTILVAAILRPLSWLLLSRGQVGRILKMNLVFAPAIIVASAIGVPYGPRGAAIAYSAVMILGVVPLSAWSVRGTVISLWDILLVLSHPLFSSAAAAGLTFGVQLFFDATLPLLPRFFLEIAVFGATYLGVLLFVANQKTFYLDLLRSALITRSADSHSTADSA
jgi:O-antigen/teichoic acid export membrane protein